MLDALHRACLLPSGSLLRFPLVSLLGFLIQTPFPMASLLSGRSAIHPLGSPEFNSSDALDQGDTDALPHGPPPLQEDPLDSLKLFHIGAEGELPTYANRVST